MGIEAHGNDGHYSTGDTTLSSGVPDPAGYENEVAGLRDFDSSRCMGDNKASGGITNQKRVSGEDEDTGNAGRTRGFGGGPVPDESRQSSHIGQEDNQRLHMASKRDSRSNAFPQRGPDSTAQGSGQTGRSHGKGRLCQSGSSYPRGGAEIDCRVAPAASPSRYGESGGSGSGGGCGTQPDLGESHGRASVPRSSRCSTRSARVLPRSP